MGAKAGGKASGNGEAGEWGRESDGRIRRSVVKWKGKSWKTIGGFDDEGDIGWGYGLGPNEYNGGIGRLDIGSYSVRGDDKSGKPGGNADEWRGEGLVNFLQSTKTLRVGGRVLRQTSRGRTRRRCSRRRCRWTGR